MRRGFRPYRRHASDAFGESLFNVDHRHSDIRCVSPDLVAIGAVTLNPERDSVVTAHSANPNRVTGKPPLSRIRDSLSDLLLAGVR
jgi:hypothetical protein